MQNACYKAKKLMQDYIEGELEKEDMLFMENHIKSCKGCAEEYNYLNTLINDISHIKNAQPNEEFFKQLHQRLENEPHKKATVFHLRRFTQIAAAAAVIAAAVIYAGHNKAFIKNVTDDISVKQPQQTEITELPDVTVNTSGEETNVSEMPDKQQSDTIEQTTTQENTKSQTPQKYVAETDAPENDVQHTATDEQTAQEAVTEDIEDKAPQAGGSGAPASISAQKSDEDHNSPQAFAASSDLQDSPVAAKSRAYSAYCRYSVDLSDSPEIFEQLKSVYDGEADGETYIITADGVKLAEISEFLSDHGKYLEYIGTEENENIIDIKY